jgi:hypothetical protein
VDLVPPWWRYMSMFGGLARVCNCYNCYSIKARKHKPTLSETGSLVHPSKGRTQKLRGSQPAISSSLPQHASLPPCETAAKAEFDGHKCCTSFSCSPWHPPLSASPQVTTPPPGHQSAKALSVAANLGSCTMAVRLSPW